MQLQIDVNNLKANIFLRLLDTLKEDDMIRDYKIIDNKNDIELIYNEALKDIKSGNFVSIKNLDKLKEHIEQL